MPPVARSNHVDERRDARRDRRPQKPLRQRIVERAALQQLRDADEHRRDGEYQKEATDPECDTHCGSLLRLESAGARDDITAATAACYRWEIRCKRLLKEA